MNKPEIKWNKTKRVETAILIGISIGFLLGVLVGPGIFFQRTSANPSSHLDVEIYPKGLIKAYVNQTVMLTAIVYNDTSPFTFKWLLNGSEIGSQQVLEFVAFTQPSNETLTVTVEVLDSYGNFGYATTMIIDPATINIYLDDLPATASYTIKTDNTNYWAVRYDGYKAWESTTFATVSNNVNDALTSTGGLVHYGKGTFTVTAILKIGSASWSTEPIVWEGEGFSTVFKAGANLVTIIQTKRLDSLMPNRRLEIRNLKIDGNKGVYTTGGDGIQWDVWGGRISRLNVYNCKDDGINLKGFAGGESNSVDNIIEDSIIVGNEGDGISNEAGAYGGDTVYRNNIIYDNDNNGIYSNTGDNQITGNQIYTNLRGIYLDKTQWGIVSENHIEGNERSQIYIASGAGAPARMINIEDNQFYGRPGTDNTYSHIYISGVATDYVEHVKIIGNHFLDYPTGNSWEYAINLFQYANETLILGNDFWEPAYFGTGILFEDITVTDTLIRSNIQLADSP